VDTLCSGEVDEEKTLEKSDGIHSVQPTPPPHLSSWRGDAAQTGRSRGWLQERRSCVPLFQVLAQLSKGGSGKPGSSGTV